MYYRYIEEGVKGRHWLYFSLKCVADVIVAIILMFSFVKYFRNK